MKYKENKIPKGKWIRYKKGLSYNEKNNLEEMFRNNTNWNTYIYLDGEDSLYVYFTKDENGKYTKPRIQFTAYSKDNTLLGIDVIQGVGKNNAVEGTVVDALEKKLKELNIYEEYKKDINDTKILSCIEMKHKNGIELSNEELLFLYEINYFIDCTGIGRNPIINEIRKERNTKEDIAKLFNCKTENVGTDLKDFDNNQIIIYYGNLFDTKIKDISKLKSLVAVVGDVYFNYTTNSKCLPSLEFVYGYLRLDQLKDASGLKIRYIGRDAHLNSIEFYEQVQSLEYVGGIVHFYNFDKRLETKGKKLVKQLYN